MPIHDCKGQHRWPRSGADVITSRSGGRRSITSCNECMAIKVTFEIWHGNAEEPVVTEKIVESDETQVGVKDPT